MNQWCSYQDTYIYAPRTNVVITTQQNKYKAGDNMPFAIKGNAGQIKVQLQIMMKLLKGEVI